MPSLTAYLPTFPLGLCPSSKVFFKVKSRGPSSPLHHLSMATSQNNNHPFSPSLGGHRVTPTSPALCYPVAFCCPHHTGNHGRFMSMALLTQTQHTARFLWGHVAAPGLSHQEQGGDTFSGNHPYLYQWQCLFWCQLFLLSACLRSDLEREMTTHSSVLAWRIPWTEEPGRPRSMGSWRVGHDWSDWACIFTFYCAFLK